MTESLNALSVRAATLGCVVPELSELGHVATANDVLIERLDLALRGVRRRHERARNQQRRGDGAPTLRPHTTPSV